MLQEEISVATRADNLKNELVDKMISWVDSFILNLPNFVLAFIVFVLFIFIAKYSGKIVDKIIRRTAAQDSVRVITIKVLKVSVILIGFFIALGILDLSKVLTSVLGAAGVAGLAIGLALQGTLNNTFAGVIISFIPRIQIGDWIESGNFSGRVVDINLRSVVLQPSDQNLVVIPNSDIVNTPFKNYSRTQRGRIIVECGVGYESDLEKVERITRATIEKHFKQDDGESIDFFYEQFGDSSIDFSVWFWSNVRDGRDVFIAKHKAILEIKKAFDANDINIPFPIRTLDFGKNKFRAETLTIKKDNEDK
jgi:small conductance mechanosensitive channel